MKIQMLRGIESFDFYTNGQTPKKKEKEPETHFFPTTSIYRQSQR